MSSTKPPTKKALALQHLAQLQHLLTRRQFLGWSAATLGLGATTWAAWRYRSEIVTIAKQDRDSPTVPPSVDPQPTSPSKTPAKPTPTVILPHEKDYATFLSTLDLRYISPHEVIRAHRRERNGVANVLPPRKYWSGMVPTLQVADELRERLGVKLSYITSAFRSTAYNAQCPGASPRSFHTKNIALDLVYDCPPAVAMKEAKKMRDEGIFLGGLGLYNTFIHIDTRGRNATWGKS